MLLPGNGGRGREWCIFFQKQQCIHSLCFMWIWICVSPVLAQFMKVSTSYNSTAPHFNYLALGCNLGLGWVHFWDLGVNCFSPVCSLLIHDSCPALHSAASIPKIGTASSGGIFGMKSYISHTFLTLSCACFWRKPVRISEFTLEKKPLGNSSLFHNRREGTVTNFRVFSPFSL